MKFKQSYLELCVLFLIFYSIITHFIELEFYDIEAVGEFFLWSERIVAVAFTIEYLFRWIASRKIDYPLQPMAVIDLLAVLPFYLGFLVDMRTLRLIRAVRVTRLFKLYRYTDAVKTIQNAFNQVRYEFRIIGFAVLSLAWICSVAIYELEKDVQPQVFARLTDAVWYTMTTLTTVGYGDKVPITMGGRMVAIVMMLCGLCLFGTFVSLIGGALIEELRKHPRRSTKKLHPHAVPHLSEIDESVERFDPGHILHAIHAGTFNSDDDLSRTKAVRLLTTACHLLTYEKTVRTALDEGRVPGVNSEGIRSTVVTQILSGDTGISSVA